MTHIRSRIRHLDTGIDCLRMYVERVRRTGPALRVYEGWLGNE